jgi:hypothetical protein
LEALRFVGEKMREFDEDIWVRNTMILCGGDIKAVIPDTRKINEAQTVLEAGGEVWYVERPGFTSNEPCDRQLLAVKEMASRIILNDGSVEDLQRKVTYSLR